MNLQTVRTICKELGIPEIRVRRAIEAGKLDTMKLGSRTLVDLDTAREILKPVMDGATIEDVSKETGLNITAIRRGIREGWIFYPSIQTLLLIREIILLIIQI